MRKKSKSNKGNQHRTTLSLFVFSMLLLGVVLINYIAYRSIDIPNTMAAFSLNSLLFLFIGMILISLSAFVFIHLFQYKTGKYFSIYTLLVGLSISLVPSVFISPLLSSTGTILALISSFFLYKTIGLLTQITNRKLYRILNTILLLIVSCGILAELIQFTSIENQLFRFFVSESANISIISCALFSIATMLFYYRKSNIYAKKQIRVLLMGIAVGFLIFIAAYNLPYMYIVQTLPSEQPTDVEIILNSSHILLFYFPLLLFSGISAAIVLMLFKRDFISTENRVSILEYLGSTLFLFLSNAILFLYANLSVWVLVCFNIVLFIPIILLFYRLLKRQSSSEEEAYRWNLLEELENERQELSVFLHDEVLQSIIAYYRQIQSEPTGRHKEMGKQLSKLISQIRTVSHNLYPTIVEDIGLDNSIQAFVDELRADNGNIEIGYEYKLGAGILPKPVTLAFYRIVRELVTNAIKHSACKTIMISLTEDENGFFVRVKDNGHGFSFPDNKTLLEASHMGLYTVKQQIAKLRGQMSFQSDEKNGTDFYIYFPGKELMLHVN